MKVDYEEQSRRQMDATRSVVNVVMGIIFILVGVFFFFRDNWDISLNKRMPPDWKDKLLGVMCFFYGSWRVYRGARKKQVR